VAPLLNGGLADSLAGRSVLVTGHTGFKGSWLCLLLHRLGARVSGYSLAPPTDPSNFVVSKVSHVLQDAVEADIRDGASLKMTLRKARPDVVLHLAAQSVVREGHAEPFQTFSVNVMGTASLLEVIRQEGSPCAVVIVSSDKCYENDGSGKPFSEGDPLGGADPYSASKAAAELVTAAYRRSFFPPDDLPRHGVSVASARAGNVIGGGDWTSHGIVADALRALAMRLPIPVRNPHAIRPWQHVLEPLGGYLALAVRLMDQNASTLSAAWNFGPDHGNEATVKDLVEKILAAWGEGTWEERRAAGEPAEADVLRLANQAAVTELGWRPRWTLDQAVDRTVKWFRRFAADPEAAHEACLADIDAYLDGI
jgi:CDP-glucose 4,6-dehydratase